MTVRINVQLGAALAARRGSVPDRAGMRSLLRRAVRTTLAHQETGAADISVTLLDDHEITELNRRFLSHAGPTDVISFPLYEEGEPVMGDIYIGFEQAQRQALIHDVPLTEEAARLVVHGVLHVLGHDHPEGTARLRSPMWRMQEEILAGVLVR